MRTSTARFTSPSISPAPGSRASATTTSRRRESASTRSWPNSSLTWACRYRRSFAHREGPYRGMVSLIRWTGSEQDERSARSVGFVGWEIDDGGDGEAGADHLRRAVDDHGHDPDAFVEVDERVDVGDLLGERGHDGAVHDRGGVDGSGAGDGYQLEVVAQADGAVGPRIGLPGATAGAAGEREAPGGRGVEERL